jgi:hypothetical protein
MPRRRTSILMQVVNLCNPRNPWMTFSSCLQVSPRAAGARVDRGTLVRHEAIRP